MALRYIVSMQGRKSCYHYNNSNFVHSHLVFIEVANVSQKTSVVPYTGISWHRVALQENQFFYHL